MWKSLGDVSGLQEIVVEVLNQQRHFANLGLAALELQPATHADPLAKVNLLVWCTVCTVFVLKELVNTILSCLYHDCDTSLHCPLRLQRAALECCPVYIFFSFRESSMQAVWSINNHSRPSLDLAISPISRCGSHTWTVCLNSLGSEKRTAEETAKTHWNTFEIIWVIFPAVSRVVWVGTVWRCLESGSFPVVLNLRMATMLELERVVSWVSWVGLSPLSPVSRSQCQVVWSHGSQRHASITGTSSMPFNLLLYGDWNMVPRLPLSIKCGSSSYPQYPQPMCYGCSYGMVFLRAWWIACKSRHHCCSCLQLWR